MVVRSTALRGILDKHKQYLQREINRFVEEQETTKAHSSLAKLKDIDKILILAQNRITELQKGDK